MVYNKFIKILKLFEIPRPTSLYTSCHLYTLLSLNHARVGMRRRRGGGRANTQHASKLSSNRWALICFIVGVITVVITHQSFKVLWRDVFPGFTMTGWTLWRDDPRNYTLSARHRAWWQLRWHRPVQRGGDDQLPPRAGQKFGIQRSPSQPPTDARWRHDLQSAAVSWRE